MNQDSLFGFRRLFFHPSLSLPSSDPFQRSPLLFPSHLSSLLRGLRWITGPEASLSGKRGDRLPAVEPIMKLSFLYMFSHRLILLSMLAMTWSVVMRLL